MATTNTSAPSIAGSKSLRQVMQQHPLFSYFLLAYAFSWITLIPYILSEWGVLPKASFFTLFYIIHTFGPSLSGILMTRILEGKEGLIRLRARINQRQAGWQWYLFILLGIPALVMIGVVVQPGALASFQGFTPAILISYVINYVLVFFAGGPLGEEIGWRGFALPRMQPRYGPLWGSLLLGFLWTCWHLVDFLTASKGGGPGTSFNTFLLNFLVYLLMVTSLSIIFTWVFNHTQGSIFTAIVAHASVNTPELALVPLFVAVDMIALHRAGLIAFAVTAILIILFTRGRLGYQPEQNPSLKAGEIKSQPND